MHPLPLIRAAHIGPAVAVTLVVTLLASAADLGLAVATSVVAAVFAGQLTFGWGNDLLDVERDRAVGRTDKPIPGGQVTARAVLVALLVAAGACVALSILAGWRSAVLHLLVVLPSGHAYNAGMKATAWSWLPYATAFGSLPAVVTLAGASPVWPPSWMLGTAAALGVAAHFLNALPDFDDDHATGIRGLPHRLGARPSRVAAAAVLVTASVVAVLGPVGRPTVLAVAALIVVLALAAVALAGRGRAPFHAAIAIALVDVALLTVARP